jgi:arylsulfatase A-like enzyme
LLIADDLGFGDLGAYGAEVDTPNLDRLAAQGVQFTNFHTAATCSPSRSMLLTGVDNHRNGLGSMGEFLTPNQVGAPGYEGYLNDRVRTLGEWLGGAGYFTAFVGKWHLGMQPTQWPAARGFERSFALLDGSGDNWSDIGPAPILPTLTFTRNGKRVERPEGFSSELFVDELLAALDDKPEGQPFLAVLSFQAVHWPHHAPQDMLDKYAHTYDAGWDVIRRARHSRMRERGIIGKDVPHRERDPAVPAWKNLSPERQRLESARMAAYAAMTEDMDREIGRVLAHLEEQGARDDTIVVFVSDNGPDQSEPDRAPRAIGWYAERYPAQAVENIGGPGSFPSYGTQWAQLGSVHLRYYKGSSAEGGMRVPFIVHAPGRVQAGVRTSAFAFATDVVPTLLEAAGVEATPAKAAKLHPFDGTSMLAMLRGENEHIHPPDTVTGYELMVGSALFQGRHKILKTGPPTGDGSWMLFDIERDPGEIEDLRSSDPATFDRLMELYRGYARDYGVIPMAEGFDVFKALTSETSGGASEEH